MTTKSLSLDEQRARLERRANVIRSRLLRTIDALDNRRHQVQEIGHHAKRLATPALFTAAGVAALGFGTAFLIRAIVVRSRERHFGYRLRKAIEPYRTEPRPSLMSEVVRKVTLTAVGILATELAKRGARAVANGRPLAGPIAPRALMAGTPGALPPPMLAG
jgi:hypothetical protein